MLGSCFLAGVILKMGIVFVGNFSGEMVIFVVIMSLRAIMMMIGSDGKVLMAYSSVVHITGCAFVMG